MRYAALDAWRGIVAILVVLFHLNLAGYFFDLPFVRGGGKGVDFFFVLSGFVMAQAYGRKIRDWAGALRFIVRRFGRIYPLHLFTLMLMVGLEVVKLGLVSRAGVVAGDAPFHGASSWPALMGNLLLVNGLGLFRDFTWNSPSWSVSTEFFTYLLFAGAVLFAPKRFRLFAGVIAGAAAAALVLNQYSAQPLSTIRGEGLLRCVCGFFLGTLTFSAYEWLSPRVAPSGRLEWAALTLVAATFVVHVPMEGVVCPLIFALALFVFAFEKGEVSKLLATPIPQHLGKISYSLYMLHFPAITLMTGGARAAQALLDVRLFSAHGERMLIDFGPRFAMDALAVAFVLVLMGASTVTFHLIEDPARRATSRFSQRIGRDGPSRAQSSPRSMDVMPSGSLLPADGAGIGAQLLPRETKT